MLYKCNLSTDTNDVLINSSGKPWSMSSALEVDSKARDVTFLDAYAIERWECVLHYMVGSQQQEGISADAVRILLHAGLMKRYYIWCYASHITFSRGNLWLGVVPTFVLLFMYINKGIKRVLYSRTGYLRKTCDNQNQFCLYVIRDEDDGSPVITRQGFQFLLLDRQAQVWHFLLQYLDTVEQRGLDLAECLTFLFQLSFSTLGKVSEMFQHQILVSKFSIWW